MKDIYFEPNYGKLYEEVENGSSEVFITKRSYGEVKHIFIKRPIFTSFSNVIYYDLITPYGYGGPMITYCEKNKKENLIAEFYYEFKQYCLNNNIVSEFVRFHPLVNNAEDFKSCYEISFNRKTVGTNLACYDDPIKEEFSKSCRKNIRKIIEKGVNYKIVEKPKDVNEFIEVYSSTLKRNSANDYYYFNEKYFKNCVNYFQKNLLLVKAIYKNKTIAMGLYFVYEDKIHIHLSGTLSEYLYLSPAYVLRYAVTLWGAKNGYKIIHHGGGRTSEPEDSLFKFKKQFGKNTEFNFYVANKVWDIATYNKLFNSTKTDTGMAYTSAYNNISEGQ